MNVTDQSFIGEHINDLLEFRDACEVKSYFQNNKINIDYDEIKKIKEAVQLVIKDYNSSCILNKEDLANVSGGKLDSSDAQWIALGCTVVGLSIGLAIPLGLSKAGFAGAANFVSLGAMTGLNLGQVAGEFATAAGRQNDAVKEANKYGDTCAANILNNSTITG